MGGCESECISAEQRVEVHSVGESVPPLHCLPPVAGTPDPRTAAIYYFLAGILLLIAFDTYFALPLLVKNELGSAQREKASTEPGSSGFTVDAVICKSSSFVW